MKFLKGRMWWRWWRVHQPMRRGLRGDIIVSIEVKNKRTKGGLAEIINKKKGEKVKILLWWKEKARIEVTLRERAE